MNKVAEYGIASHWSYKAHGSDVKTVKDSMEAKLQIFRSIMQLNEEYSKLESKALFFCIDI